MPGSGKGKRRGKRQRKKEERLRVVHAGSPYERIGHSGSDLECYINPEWREDGMASVYVIRPKPGGGHALASFLLDLACLGLKDIHGRLDITRAEFDEILHTMRESIGVARVDADTVRRLVAGGVRFARENGFRLPPRYERWTALLGDLGDIDQADTGDFGIEGKLQYTGTLRDLKQRLVGCTIDELLRREDFEWIMDPETDEGLEELREAADPELASLTEEQEAITKVEQAVERIRTAVLEKVRQRCFAVGEPPSPRLGEAWDVVMEAMLQGPPPSDDQDSDAAVDPATHRRLEELLAFEGTEGHDELLRAMAQVQAFMQSFQSIEEFSEAIGLPPPGADEDDDP